MPAQGEEQAGQAPLLPLRRHGRGRTGPRIEFLCTAEDHGVVAEPVPARGVHPAWFRALPGVDDDELSAHNNGLTVKRCMPFLDALNHGWLMPLAAGVRLEIADGGTRVEAGWEFDEPMVSVHDAFQAAGNPYEPRPVLKFHSPWAIRTTPGWSCLFVQPLNRPGLPFEILSGVVDTDRYVAPVNFPFVATAGDGVHSIARGTPIAQVVPFRRERLEGVVRAETDEEAFEREQVQRSTKAGPGWYKTAARSPR